MTRSLEERIHAACYLAGEFRLRSGQTSDHYFDKYRFEADPALLREVGEALAALLPANIELIAGLELGGVPLATIVSQITGIPARFVRKAPKTYGTQMLAEGGEIEGKRLLIVEDIVSTGGQIIESVAELRARGADCAHTLCVILRDPVATSNLAQHGIALTALFDEDRKFQPVSDIPR